VQAPGMLGWAEPLGAPELLAVGARSAVVRTAVGHFALHRDRGVVGRLRLPLGWFWLGLDGADALYVATSDGALYRSDDATERADASFVPVALVQGAVTWDLAGSLLVAGQGSEVLVSRDRGHSYLRATVSPNVTIRRVRIRTDGVIAVWGHDRAVAVTHLSTDGGRTWVASDYLPRHIDRRGAAIDNGAPNCPASLSQDGRRWFRGRPEARSLERWWTDQLRITSVPTASQGTAYVSDIAPAALPAGEPLTGAETTCAGAPSGKASSATTPASQGDEGRSCRGVNCLRGTGGRAVATSTRVGLFADASCRPKAATTSDACDPSQPLSRPPHLAAVDQESGTVALASPPSGCTPRHLTSIRGAGLLICERANGRVELYTLSRAGKPYREAAFDWPAKAVGTITTGDDGTTVVTCDRSTCAGRALVRSPHPLGDQSAWREVAVPQAVTYRPLLLGAALALTSPATAKMARPGAFGNYLPSDLLGGNPSGGERPLPTVAARVAKELALVRQMSFVIARADGTVRPQAADLRSKGDVVQLEVVDGAVYLAIQAWVSKTAGDKPKALTYYRLDRGQLVALPRPPDALRRDRQPSGGATVRGTGNAYGVALDEGRVYWTDFDRSRVLSVAKTGGKVTTLASQQPGAFAITVDGTHVYFTLRGSGYLADGSVRRVVKQGGTVEQIATEQLRPEAIATDADGVYWAARGYPGALDGAILRASKHRAAIGPLAVGLPEPSGIAVDHGHVWFTTALGGTVSRVAKAGGKSEALVADQLAPRALVVSSGRATWSNGAAGMVAAAPVDGASGAAAVVRGLPGLLGLAVCGNETYVTTDRGEIWTVSAAGRRRLADRVVGAGSLACDGSHVYVSIHEGRRVVAIPVAGGKPRTLGGATVGGKPMGARRKLPKLKRR